MTATAAIVSFRLGGADGVSVVAERWRETLCELGFAVSTVAGEGRVDRLVPGLAIDAREDATVDDVKRALDGIDLVIVENLLSIPMNLSASRVVAEVLRTERKRALVVIFTTLDPGALGEGLVPVLPSLVSRHTVFVAAVHDPAHIGRSAAGQTMSGLRAPRAMASAT